MVQGASEDVVQAQLAPAPDDPQPLSEEDIAEKDKLLGEGYSNWNRRDFNSFTRACEKVRLKKHVPRLRQPGGVEPIPV